MHDTVKVQMPPVIRTVDGEMYVEVIYDNTLILAPIGDGSYFVSQVLERIIKPRLLTTHSPAPAR